MSHLFVLILLALPLAAQAIVIDNGIPMGTVGHWSVDVLTGGATQSAVFTTQIPTSGAVVTENVVSSYRVFVDPGIDGQGFELQGFEPIIDIFNNNRVSSSGTFVGANGNTIHWEAISRVEPGTKHLATGYSFFSDTGEPIGPLRVFQYLDGDIQGSDATDPTPDALAPASDNVFQVVGTTATDTNIVTLDGIERFGVGQFGNVGNFTFAGLAADSFDQIQERIVGSGQPVSTTNTEINLAPPNEPGVFENEVYGPENVVSVLAWDVTPGAHDAFMDLSLSGRDPPPPPGCDSGCEPPPVAPAKEQFSCRTSGCVVPITCNLTTQCDTKVDLFVNVKSIRLKDGTMAKASRRIRFAAAVANILPGATVIVRPKLTKRGRSILRANRNKKIKGVMVIRNAITGDLFSSTRVRIRLK